MRVKLNYNGTFYEYISNQKDFTVKLIANNKK